MWRYTFQHLLWWCFLLEYNKIIIMIMWKMDFIDPGNWQARDWLTWLDPRAYSKPNSPNEVPPTTNGKVPPETSCQVQKQDRNWVSLAWLKYVSEISMARNMQGSTWLCLRPVIGLSGKGVSLWAWDQVKGHLVIQQKFRWCCQKKSKIDIGQQCCWAIGRDCLICI